MTAASVPFFVIGLIVGMLAGWFVLLVISCLWAPVLSSRISRDERNRSDGPYSEAYDDGMEWVLGKDQQYRRVKKP